MSTTRKEVGRVGDACVLLLTVLWFAGDAVGADLLFPTPLHITRELSSTFSSEKTVIDEYCHGNRIVSISGRRTAIVDHARREMTVIDFGEGTYSITTFETIARLHETSASPVRVLSATRNEWRVESRGGRVVASRPGERIEAARDAGSSRQLLHVTADRQLTLSRAAAEALLGGGYPNRRDDAMDIVLGALRSRERRAVTNGAGTGSEEQYFLPLEYNVAFEIEGETLQTGNVVVRVGDELPPPDLLAVPPGAKLVESDAVLSRRLLEDLDRPVRAGKP